MKEEQINKRAVMNREDKKCSKCGKLKPANEFYSHSFKRCKECIRIYNAQYRKKNNEKHLQRNRDYYRKNKAKYKKYRDKYEIKNPEKTLAQRRIANRISKGTLKKPNKCSSCSTEGLMHGHHEDYSKPYEVIWLCRNCHIELHKNRRKNEQKRKAS